MQLSLIVLKQGISIFTQFLVSYVWYVEWILLDLTSIGVLTGFNDTVVQVPLHAP